MPTDNKPASTHIANRFLRNTGGNFATVFAIAMLPVTLGVGIAVEYTATNHKRSAYQEAVDSAVLAAAIEFSESGDKRAARQQGHRYFRSNCDSYCEAGDRPQFRFASDGSVTGTVNGRSPGGFSSLFGTEAWEFSVAAEAGAAAASGFEEVHFIVDVSASLGIASGNGEVSALMRETQPYVSAGTGYAPNGCAFACHEVTPESWEKTDPRTGNKMTTYDWARDEGIRLRNDVLEDEFHEALRQILPPMAEAENSRFTAALHVFSDTTAEIVAPTARINDITEAYQDSRIPLRRWGSRHDLVLPQIASRLGTQGSGSSKTDPVKTVVLVTDGVTSNYENFDFSPINPASCQAFKDNGITVAVLDIEYPELNGDQIFEDMVADFYNRIEPNLRACASDGYYFQTARDGEISRKIIDIIEATRVAKRIALRR